MKVLSPVVSFDSDELILVDEEDNPMGYKNKVECHQGNGILHRAFSVFLFNEKIELLMQQRSETKMLWPMVWSNTCCSHPRRNESIYDAAQRRMQEELSVDAKLEYLFKFSYQARYRDIGSENELCSVLAGKLTDSRVEANSNEVNDWRMISADKLDEEIFKFPDNFTPWFKIEWECLKINHWDKILDLIES